MFSPAAMEAYGIFRACTLKFAEDMTRSENVKKEWVDSHGLELRAATGMFKVRIMQDVSVTLIQVTANAYNLQRI